MSHVPIIMVPVGDPNGIGPEIAVKAAVARRDAAYRIVLAADAHVVARYHDNEHVRPVDIGSLPSHDPAKIDLCVVEALNEVCFEPGNCNAQSGLATVAYVEVAIRAVQSGVADAVVACPHNESAVNAAGIPFSGYPSLVAGMAGVSDKEVFLMLDGGGLRIVHATLHEGVRNALARIDEELVLAACRAAHEAMLQFGASQPRIGLFGINPHAGEGGLFGDDDEKVTFPAAARARDCGMDIIGPMGADLLLSQQQCDAYVAMFHDQGHIPIKLLSDRRSTAFSVGAGLIFASVGHGSAPDIAGKNLADPEPLLRTLDMIAAMLAKRNEDIAA